jgi:hypothetical protein
MNYIDTKTLYPPDTPILLRKSTIQRLDGVREGLIKPVLTTRDDIVLFLVHYWESNERIMREAMERIKDEVEAESK